jgi:hypothetical protein
MVVTFMPINPLSGLLTPVFVELESKNVTALLRRSMVTTKRMLKMKLRPCGLEGIFPEIQSFARAVAKQSRQQQFPCE